jgi:phage gp36-like protein
MPYATLADLIVRTSEDELIQLTDPAHVQVLDEDVVNMALVDASTVIDGYLAGRYPVPLDPVPPILVGYCCDMALARLYRDAIPEHKQRRADDAVKFLAAVAKGHINLGPKSDPAGDDQVQVVTAERRRYGVGL